MFIVHPATAWILRPGRFERKKSIMYAIAFLTALAAVKTGISMQARGPNHYTLLGVSRESNPLEIKRSYKKISLKLHPDKNPSPNASDEFDTVKQAYDVLMDMELRDVYNKFGADGIQSNKRFDENQFFIELGIFYITWGSLRLNPWKEEWRWKAMDLHRAHYYACCRNSFNDSSIKPTAFQNFPDLDGV